MKNSHVRSSRKRTWAGVLALAACVGVLSPAGVAHATDDTEATIGAADEALGGLERTLGVTIAPSRVTLTDGKAWDVHAQVVRLTPTIDAEHQYAADLRGDLEVDAMLGYRISMLDKPRPYWVGMYVANHGLKVECAFYDGDPTAEGKKVDAAPFSCRSDWEWVDSGHRHLKYAFEIGLNPAAAASGTITPRELSLADGTFRSDVSYTVAGKTALARRETTSFEAVMLEGDKPFYENQARTEWAYQIIDGKDKDGKDKPTGLWAAGVSTNYRAWDRFRGDGRCAIYDHNPLLGRGRLDGSNSIEHGEFFCTAKGDYRHLPGDDGNSHYHADFTIGRY